MTPIEKMDAAVERIHIDDGVVLSHRVLLKANWDALKKSLEWRSLEDDPTKYEVPRKILYVDLPDSASIDDSDEYENYVAHNWTHWREITLPGVE